MCAPEALDYASPAISAVAFNGGNVDPRLGNAGKTAVYIPGEGGYVKSLSDDANDPGRAPEGYYSQYRFGPDGQIMGSLDGKKFDPIQGLKADQAKISAAYKQGGNAPRQNALFTTLAEQLYSANNNQATATKAFADGGDVKDFRVGKDGQLYARLNSGAVGGRAPTNLSGFGDSGEIKGVEFEGYIPIEGFPLTESEGNFGEGGRSAFFSPDGAIALNAGRKEEFPGLLSAYTRKKMQSLKSADSIDLLTGTRGGG